MIDAQLMSAILDSLKDPVLFADTEHTIRYMNAAAVSHYEEGAALIGRSVLECHNDASCRTIRETFAAFEAGEDERLISESDTQRIYMRAVRDDQAGVIGYYERYEALHP